MEDYKEQLGHIKEMRLIMERSNKFLSLSGLSGILCGTYALIAAGIAYYLIYVYPQTLIDNSAEFSIARFTENYIEWVRFQANLDFKLVTVGVITLIFSLGTALYLSNKKAEKQGDKLWNASSKTMLLHLLIPLLSGGAFGLISMYKGWFVVIGPITLIFYGLALVSAAKFTYGEILYLGILQVLLGLTSMFFLGYSLFFWAFGFGVLHIVYGIAIHLKYERKAKTG